MRTSDELILIAQRFIQVNGIVDEDVKQDIYIKALESKHTKTNQEITKKLSGIIKHSMNKDDVYVAVDTVTVSYSDAFKSVEQNMIHNQLLLAMDNISDKEKRVLKLRFVNGMTLKSTGEELNLCSERIRQIEAKALRKLRRPVNSKLIKDFLIEGLTFTDSYGVTHCM